MPDDFYKWYAPIRFHCSKVAKAMMFKKLGKLLEDTLGEEGYQYIREGERIFFETAEKAIELGETRGMKPKDFER